MDFRHSDKYRKFGLNVAYYRKDRHFTQEGLAEVIDVDRSTIAKIEGATAGASMDTLFDIADALELPAYKLLEFRD
ncbi:helix-turn-helix transcriptional regulator [Agathobaculum sp. TL06]